MESGKVEPNQIMSTKRIDRNMGIELLRIISIFLIVCVHLLNAGGFKANSESIVETRLLGLLDTIFSTSVNVFVIITGFFCVKGTFRPKRLLNLWLVVVYYMVLSYLLCTIIGLSDFDLKSFISCFFPLFFDTCWFFSMYFILYLISPFLNKILNNSSFKELLYLFSGILILTIIRGFSRLDAHINLGWGYNLLWFICLYIIGGVLRLHTPKLKVIYWIGLYFLSTIINYISFFSGDLFSILRCGAASCEQYSSFWVLCASISMFMIFYNINFKSTFMKKVISLVSSTVFSIYIFDALNIRSYLNTHVFKIQNFYGQTNSILYVLLFALVTFLIAFVVDLIRQLLVRLIKKVLSKKLKSKHNHSLEIK